MGNADDESNLPLHPLVDVVRREMGRRSVDDAEFVRLVIRDELKGFVGREEISRNTTQAIEGAFDKVGMPIDADQIKSTQAAVRRLMFWSEVGGKFFKGLLLSFLGGLATYLTKKYGPEGW